MDAEIDGERFRERFEAFGEIGATEAGGVSRPALSEANREARDRLVAWFEEAGLDVTVDEMGNIFGRRAGERDEPPVMVGSHVDSQHDGGRYDGVVGVLGGLEVVEALTDAGVTTRRPIEIAVWSNEEGVRFQPDMLGSGVFAGRFDLEYAYDREDGDGTRFGDELERIGYRGEAACEPRDLDSYLELHVEQGPYLEENGKDVGVVTGVVGFKWGAITYYGEADHSGPTPMHHRRDALVPAADVITQIRRLPGTLGDRTVGTVGYVDVQPNSINIIPDEVTFTWGVRDPTSEVLEEAYEHVLAEAEAAAEREGVEWEHEDRMDADPVHFADRCVDAVENAAEELGYDAMRIFSGAGHDASYAHTVCDTGMVFAVSEDGKSHTEEEYTSWDDCYSAANTLASAAFDLAQGD